MKYMLIVTKMTPNVTNTMCLENLCLQNMVVKVALAKLARKCNFYIIITQINRYVYAHHSP